MELVKPVEPVLWACIVELVMGGTGYGTVEALILTCHSVDFFALSPRKSGRYANSHLLPAGDGGQGTVTLNVYGSRGRSVIKPQLRRNSYLGSIISFLTKNKSHLSTER